MPKFYEFFAGGGMARAGLGPAWQCLFANDFDRKKGNTYAANWGDEALTIGDVKKLTIEDVPGTADLAWASFPCQDLSLAGGGAGLKGDRSGTFWPFWSIMTSLIADGRAPKMIVLENVCGTLTSHEGKDFKAIADTYQRAGYRFGAMVIDAALFLPHSRPRLFMVGVRDDVAIPSRIIADTPSNPWHTRTLKTAYMSLSPKDRKNWIWWRLPVPTQRATTFSQLIEDAPSSVSWHTPAETKKLIGMMSDLNRAKLDAVKALKRRLVGTIYKRTRTDEDGFKVQRAEVRFDDISGCLRTPAGGSSRQVIIVVDGNRIRSRLISARETARLMGLADAYQLPVNYNEAYHLTGDGVAVPVVRHLAQHIIEPIIGSARGERRSVAA